jgi:hypothetical protein
LYNLGKNNELYPLVNRNEPVYVGIVDELRYPLGEDIMQPNDLPGVGPLSDDLMIGATALAKWLGLPPRKVFYIAETKQLPFF